MSELQPRTDVVEIKKYDDIMMTEYNHTIVWDYLKKLGRYLEDDMVPCMCIMWKDELCRFRKRMNSIYYVMIFVSIQNILMYDVMEFYSFTC